MIATNAYQPDTIDLLDLLKLFVLFVKCLSEKLIWCTPAVSHIKQLKASHRRIERPIVCSSAADALRVASS
jgi:hypothetical protein